MRAKRMTHVLVTSRRSMIGKQVAEAGAHTAVAERVAQPVDGDVGVLLGAHRLPDLAGDQLGQRRAADPLDHPAQRVREDRPIVEVVAVGERQVERRDVGVEVRRRQLASANAADQPSYVRACIAFQDQSWSPATSSCASAPSMVTLKPGPRMRPSLASQATAPSAIESPRTVGLEDGRE